MVIDIAFNPGQVKQYSRFETSALDVLKGFPLLSADRDSYLVRAQVQSSIDFDVDGGRHCIAVGKGCSLADDITFLIDLNHDFSSVAQGKLAFLKGAEVPWRSARKGSVIIQNDVWVGHGATIMSGVTLHNGCVIAAGAVVTKDVPPYAVAGGTPARLLRCRFDTETVCRLQKIAWWDWPPELQEARKADFSLPAAEFAAKYLPEAERQLNSVPAVSTSGDRKYVLFIPDVDDVFPLYPKVLAQYFERDRADMELLIYIPEKRFVYLIEQILHQYDDSDNYVTLQTEAVEDERMLFRCADYFITTRSPRTVQRTCFADLYGVEILYGTDDPVFPQDGPCSCQ